MAPLVIPAALLVPYGVPLTVAWAKALKPARPGGGERDATGPQPAPDMNPYPEQTAARGRGTSRGVRAGLPDRTMTLSTAQQKILSDW